MATKKPAKKAAPNRPEFAGVIEQDDKAEWWCKGGVTPAGRVLFPSLFKSKFNYKGKEKMKNGEETGLRDREYSVTLIFNPGDPVLKSMEKKIEELDRLAWPDGKPKKIKNWYYPVKDGNDLFEEDPEKNAVYENKKYMVLKRPAHIEAPTVLDEYGEEMLAKEDFYAGCWAVARVDFKSYTNGNNGGITAYWSATKKVGDDDKLGFNQSQRAKSDFAAHASNVSVENGKATY